MIIDEYRKEHCCCPKCGSTIYVTTGKGFLDIDTNKVLCNCGWEGVGHNLISEEKWNLYQDNKASTEKYIQTLVSEGLIDSNGYPLKCAYCGGIELNHITKDSIDGIASEIEVQCSSCGKVTGYWAYGYWQLFI